jgi:hypothetical protein
MLLVYSVHLCDFLIILFNGILVLLGESPLNRNDPKSEQYSLDLLKRVIPNFQSVWKHRSELGFVPVKGTLP